METQNNQNMNPNNSTPSSDNKKTMYIITGVVIALLIGVGIVLFAGDSNEDAGDSSTTKTTTSKKDSEKYTNKVLNITSADGNISGKATINSLDEMSGISVVYNINITEAFPENLKCFTCESNSEYNHDCRSEDKYNYGGDLHRSSGDSEYFIRSQAYSVFCSEFQEADGTFGQPLTELTCILDTTGKDLTTDKYILKMQTSYDSIDELYANNVLDIYDTKDATTRNSCVDGEPGSSEMHMDVSRAVESGSPVKTYILDIEEK